MERLTIIILDSAPRGILYTIFAVLFLSGCAPSSLVEQREILQEPDSLGLMVEEEIEEDTVSVIDVIDSLIQQAHSACAQPDFQNANSTLKEALTLIENASGNIGEEDQGKLDDWLINIGELYTVAFPKEYLDSLPANIAAIVFKNQISFAIDTMSFSPDDSILLSILECDKGVPFNVPIVHNERVRKALYYIVTKRKHSMEGLLTRANYYLPFMQRLFSENNMPTDLVYLPILESGFNPKAYSYAHASGIWQFIPSTGRIYGLRKSYWLDERRDPVKSTNAAIEYLKKLHGDFNDWYLALAAYNCGEKKIERKLKEEKIKSYWQLKLPKQTMKYVPQFIAYQIIGKNPQCFGFFPEHQDTFDFDSLQISDCLDLKKIAEGINVSYSELKRINPHIRHWCTPPNMNNVNLYLPKGTLDTFQLFFASLSDKDKVRWYRYRIRSGDNLSVIANKFRISVTAIKSINHLKNNFIVAGRYLYIPIPADGTYPTPMQVASKKKYNIPIKMIEPAETASFNRKGIKPRKYRLATGETISDVSQKFNIKIKALCRWNKITNPRRVRAGTLLTLYIEDGPEKTITQMKDEIVADNTGKQFYTVRRGDNLYAISRKLGISVDKLASWNKIDIAHPIIKPGEKLVYFRAEGENKTQSRKKPDNNHAEEYRIKKGDTITKIAKRFSVTISEILSLNKLDKSTIIKPGDVLRIPVTRKGENEKTILRPSGRIVYYTVQKGDNLWRIANHFNVTVDSLYEANDLQRDSTLMPGVTIRVILPEGS